MKYFIILIALLEGYNAQAEFNLHVDRTEELICVTTDLVLSNALSCVSKISIEKDTAELELIKLQIKKLKREMNEDKEESNKGHKHKTPFTVKE
jgi:hypothetical protein